MSSTVRDELRRPLDPLVRALARTGVSPHLLTVLGLVFTGGVAWLYARGFFPQAGLALFAVGLFDTLDGQLARASGRVTRFGALLDSALDRVAEALLFGAWMYVFRENFVLTVWLFAGWTGAFMVSYLRARGEGLGHSTRKGPMDRVLRYVFWVGGSLFGAKVFAALVPVWVVLIWITVIRRLVDLRGALG